MYIFTACEKGEEYCKCSNLSPVTYIYMVTGLHYSKMLSYWRLQYGMTQIKHLAAVVMNIFIITSFWSEHCPDIKMLPNCR